MYENPTSISNGKINYQPQLVQDFSHQQYPRGPRGQFCEPATPPSSPEEFGCLRKTLMWDPLSTGLRRFFSFFFGWANLALVSDIFLGIFGSKKVHLIRIFLLKASLRWMNQSKLPSKYQKGQVVMMLCEI